MTGKVAEMDLDVDAIHVVIQPSHSVSQVARPQCDTVCPKADTAPQRKWRHLDTMQFTNEILAAIPRCNGSKRGVKTITVPWTGKHSRFRLMFEEFAIRALFSAANLKRATELIWLSWDAAQRMMQSAVERGLKRRKTEDVSHAGVDEKRFGPWHDCLSILTNPDGAHVPDVVPERNIAACDKLWKA